MDKNIDIPPLVSVLMAVYNSEMFIQKSINSILNQTFTDFEFIIINDGSTDNSYNIIRAFNDNRIKLINNESNIGQTKSLNKGIKNALGKYIVRMDADDISLTDRISTQVDFMESNPDISFSGSWFKILNTNRIAKLPITYEEIKASLFFFNAFGHPTIILRRDDFINNDLFYNEDFSVQDYELWVRASKILKCANINKVLLFYREHESQMTRLYKDEYKEPNIIREKELCAFVDCDEKEIELHLCLLTGNYICTNDFVINAINWLEKLYYQNKYNNKYSELYFSKILSTFWINLISGCRSFSLKLLKSYIKSPFRSYNKLNRIDFFKFAVKCLFNYCL